MPKQLLKNQNVAKWLDKAKSNLKRAKAAPPSDGRTWGDLCNEARQAAEKALKAVLLSRDAPFRFTHGIREHLPQLGQLGLVAPPVVQDAHRLAAYDPENESPAALERADERLHGDAVAIAEAVVAWAEEAVSAAG